MVVCMELMSLSPWPMFFQMDSVFCASIAASSPCLDESRANEEWNVNWERPDGLLVCVLWAWVWVALCVEANQSQKITETNNLSL